MRKAFLTLIALTLVTGAAWGQTINVPADQPTIEAALAAAGPGYTITIDNGIYNPAGTLTVSQPITISGASEAGVIINIPAAGGYGMIVTADDVTLENFTLATSAANINFPIHASGTSNPPNGFDNLTIQNVTVSGVHQRTGFDIHGYNNVVLANLTSSDATGGNGVQLTGVVGAMISGITTVNNAWGSLAIYSSKPVYLNRGSDDIEIDGDNCAFGEGNLYNQDEFGLTNTNIVVLGYGYGVRNTVDAPGYTFFKDTLADALAFVAFAGPANYTIQPLAGGSFVVEAGMQIQPAIDAAVPGDVINVGAGHYEEQLHVVTDDLTISGAGVGVTFVDSPMSLTASYTSSAANYPVIFVDNADGVAFSGMTLDGLGRGNANYRFQGIGYYNAGGSLTDVAVVNIMDTPFSGVQHANGVYAYTDDGGPHDFDLTNVQVLDFQKTAVVIAGAGLHSDMVNVTAVGQGPTNVTAQNGIQVSYGATAVSTDCAVSALGWIGPDWVASGLLGYQAAVWDLVDCTVDNVQVSAYMVDTSGSMDGCDVTNATYDAMYVYAGGAKSGLRPDRLRLPQPSEEDASVAAKAVVSFALMNSTFTGADIADTWGVAPYGAGTVNFTMTGCQITDFDYGYVVYDLGGAILNTVANENSIYSNVSYDGYSNATTVQDAERNYWGAVDPTASLGEPGSLDYSPWYGLALGAAPMTVGTDDDVNDALALANPGDTVFIPAATITTTAQIVVDKDITLTGIDAASSGIAAGHNTGTSAYSTASPLIYVDTGVTATVSNLTIDGSGFTVNQGIQSRGAGLTVQDCVVSNIASATYDGRGIVFLTGTGSVLDCVMSGIQRIGVHIRGGAIGVVPAPAVAVDGFTYTGKGDGDFLDYGVEFGGGGTGTVTDATITDCRGVAASDGSTSAAILVTDLYGTGTDALITTSTLTANSTGVVVGYDVSDNSHAVISGCNIEGNNDFGVTSTGVTVDATGNWWGTPFGPFHPTLNPFGTGNEVSDNVLFEPWTGMAGATAVASETGPVACGETVFVTFKYVPDPASPDLFLYNAIVSVSPEATLGAVTGMKDIFNGTGNAYFVNNLDGTVTVTAATVASGGDPYEAANGAASMFTIEVLTGSEGTATVALDGLVLRDPSNATIPVNLPSTTITIDCTAPAAVTGITAAPGHNKVHVDWTHNGADVDHYVVLGGLWYDGTVGVSAYPEYDDLPGTIPTPPSSPFVATTEWVALPDVPVGTNTATPTWPDATSRGVYYYTVFAVDAAGNASPAPAAVDRATNYWLGDVASGGGGGPDGDVGVWDINALGAAFGTSQAGGGAYSNIIDVGPTDDWSRLGIPLTDNFINFEDLMIFSLNFGVVSAGAKEKPVISNAVDLQWVTYDNGDLGLRLVEGTGLKGVRVTADIPHALVEAGDLLDAQSELTFLKNVGDALDVSVAVMGVDNGFTGTGDLFVVRGAGAVALDQLHVTARSIENKDLEVSLSQGTGTLTPRVFNLNANYPNPFNPMTKISFSLPEAQNVRLNVYSLDGRLVAKLLNETRGPGLHEVVWTGRNDDGHAVASGVYFYRIDAGPYSQVRKMTLMK